MALCIVLLGVYTSPALSLGDKMWESGNMKYWGIIMQCTELANQRVDKPSGRIGVR
jgi:hypothetical protein